jgi:dihydroorotase
MSSLLIKNGHVVDPASNLDAVADVLLRDGRVAQVGRAIKGAEVTIDAKGLIVAPGLIDLHVHLREPGQTHKETIATGTAAAAAGGFTSVCCMPNTNPINDLPALTRWMQAPERGASVNVFPVAAATVGSAGERLTDFAALQRAGGVAVTDDGKPILDQGIMDAVLRAAKDAGIPVIQHAEDTKMTGAATMNESATAFRLGLRGMKPEAESNIVTRDILLARDAGAHVHVAHLSTAGALDAVREGKRLGVQVTCEVTPHHLALIDEDVGEYRTNFKMNPPLRTAADREALLAGCADGTIDAIATDHAPHALFEKRQEFDKAPFGVTGLETALALAINLLHDNRVDAGDLAREPRRSRKSRRSGPQLPLERVIELLSTNPARIVKLEGRGSLAKGSVADVVLFDPKRRWKYDASKSRSKSHNSPFDGWPMVGKVVATIVGGKIVYRES